MRQELPHWFSFPEGATAPIPVRCAAIEPDIGPPQPPPARVGDLPVGVYSLLGTDGELIAQLAITPRELRRPERSWAWSLFLPVMHTNMSWGVGDFHDLMLFCNWSRQLGARYVFLGPTNAGHAVPPQQPSPYSPSSRLFHHIAHIHLPDLPGWPELDPEERATAQRARALTAEPNVDLDAALAAKMPLLRELFRRAIRRPASAGADGLDVFRHDQGDELRFFALYCAVETEFGQAWRAWPTALRTPATAVDSPWAREHESLIAFFEWCQWQLDRQFAAAASAGAGIVRDLPVGTPLASADAWMWQDCLAQDQELGAPPDYFCLEGHRWGLVPYRPDGLAAACYRPFQRAVRAALRHARGLRIDHALGLIRQFWISVDQGPAAGRYVAQPTEPLLDIISVEAYRQQAFVVTEELGTPPPEGPQVLSERGFLDFSPVIADGFEVRRPGGVVAASTHDLPTVAGCWTGQDALALAQCGIAADAEFAARARGRLRDIAGMADDAPADQVGCALYRALAASDAAIVVLSVEDAIGTTRRANVPGSAAQWPNFRRRLPPLSELATHHGVRRLAAAAGAGR